MGITIRDAIKVGRCEVSFTHTHTITIKHATGVAFIMDNSGAIRALAILDFDIKYAVMHPIMKDTATPSTTRYREKRVDVQKTGVLISDQNATSTACGVGIMNFWSTIRAIKNQTKTQKATAAPFFKNDLSLFLIQ
jgi:hypothetical protein